MLCLSSFYPDTFSQRKMLNVYRENKAKKKKKHVKCDDLSANSFWWDYYHV